MIFSGLTARYYMFPIIIQDLRKNIIIRNCKHDISGLYSVSSFHYFFNLQCLFVHFDVGNMKEYEGMSLPMRVVKRGVGLRIIRGDG